MNSIFKFVRICGWVLPVTKTQTMYNFPRNRMTNFSIFSADRQDKPLWYPAPCQSVSSSVTNQTRRRRSVAAGGSVIDINQTNLIWSFLGVYFPECICIPIGWEHSNGEVDPGRTEMLTGFYLYRIHIDWLWWILYGKINQYYRNVELAGTRETWLVEDDSVDAWLEFRFWRFRI